MSEEKNHYNVLFVKYPSSFLIRENLLGRIVQTIKEAEKRS